jgi:hypothetical protein
VPVVPVVQVQQVRNFAYACRSFLTRCFSFFSTLPRIVLDTLPPHEHPLNPCILLSPCIDAKPFCVIYAHASPVHRRCFVMPLVVLCSAAIRPPYQLDVLPNDAHKPPRGPPPCDSRLWA